jgi:hypothetical protein
MAFFMKIRSLIYHKRLTCATIAGIQLEIYGRKYMVSQKLGQKLGKDVT